ncbi:MAG TPA: HD-GYP domain-containing protein, partial [Usitatibacteraceae bacterium]|nr:HD-GYP domain-containing protein [Usitatibacteraceae bacterium]
SATGPASSGGPGNRFTVISEKGDRDLQGDVGAMARDAAPGLLGGLVSRMKGMLRRGEPLPENPADLPEDRPRPSLLPPGVTQTLYRDIRSVEEEVARARSTFENTAEMLHRLADDVWAGRPVSFERCEEVVDEMVESMVRNPDALMWVARLRERDRTVYGHGLQVAVYLVAFGRHLGFPRTHLAQLGTIGLLLDIGKIRLPRELLDKQGRLTSGEFETVKAHVAHSLDILEETPNWDPDVLEGIAQHHERMNGSGYPKGIAGDAIGIYGRMAGVADSFAALTKSRPYAPAVSSYEALRSISSWAGDYFHEPLVEQFIQAIGVFPVGSLVELSSGEVAVVVSHNKVRRLKPRVLVLTAPDKTPVAYPVMADLLYDPKLGGEEPSYIKRGLPAGAYGLDPRDNYLS